MMREPFRLRRYFTGVHQTPSCVVAGDIIGERTAHPMMQRGTMPIQVAGFAARAGGKRGATTSEEHGRTHSMREGFSPRLVPQVPKGVRG